MAANTKNHTKIVNIDTHYNDRLQLAMISIRDTGPGISDEMRSRVFEPYFSTKADGTGLGLAITKRIVNDHNGFIRVQPSLERGTEFVIELPTIANRTAAGVERSRPMKEPEYH